jgi:acetyl esterase/lipase
VRALLLAPLATLLLVAAGLGRADARAVKVLIITGDHGHKWQETTPFLKDLLTKAGHKVDVTEAPSRDLTPANLAKYDVLLLNYRDTPKGAKERPASVWSEANKKAFTEAVKGGKGLVVYHHASSAFVGPSAFDKEFEKTIAGGWRKQGHHGKMHEFTVTVRKDHPITHGLKEFKHGRDELYQNSLILPGSVVLATAYSDKDKDPKNTGKHEPMVWVATYGKGRVYHNALGHDVTAMQSAGFKALMVRGVEWAATGAVSTPLPAELKAPPAPAAEGPLTLDLWPGPAPGEKGDVGKEKVLEVKPGQSKVKRVTNVSHPTLTVFRPAKDKDTGAAVLIAPGGGYSILAWDLEGEEVARWLNSLGVTGVVLKYRVPRRAGTPGGTAPPQALMDAQRGLSLVRSRAKEWGVDPHRIGMLGFSAGGHLTAWASTNFDRRAYEPADAADKVSCRPDFAVLVYPAYLTAKGKEGLAPDIRVTKETPPMFLVHAADDRVPAENSVTMYRALRKAGVGAELHVYASGGHGFGLRPSAQPCSTWPARCADWLKAQGLVKARPSS